MQEPLLCNVQEFSQKPKTGLKYCDYVSTKQDVIGNMITPHGAYYL